MESKGIFKQNKCFNCQNGNLMPFTELNASMSYTHVCIMAVFVMEYAIVQNTSYLPTVFFYIMLKNRPYLNDNNIQYTK